MAYKIRLADSDTYEIPELPVETIINRKGEDLKAIKFYVPAPIAEGQVTSIKTLFSDTSKTSVMEFLEDDRSVGREYTDFTLLYLISVTEEGDYIVTMVKETAIPSKLNELEENIASITAKLAEPNIDNFSLDELKAYRVQESKKNLENYLATHTVTSTAHQGVAKEYSITSEKQGHLMSMVMMAQAAETMKAKQLAVAYEAYENKENTTLEEFTALVENGTISLTLPTFTPSWNATGEVCTYDWTLDELLILGADIENMVRPLVSKQQTMEANIINATTKEEVEAVSILF